MVGNDEDCESHRNNMLPEYRAEKSLLLRATFLTQSMDSKWDLREEPLNFLEL